MDINQPKCNAIDCIDFFIAASNVFSCTEAARYYPNVATDPFNKSGSDRRIKESPMHVKLI